MGSAHGAPSGQVGSEIAVDATTHSYGVRGSLPQLIAEGSAFGAFELNHAWPTAQVVAPARGCLTEVDAI